MLFISHFLKPIEAKQNYIFYCFFHLFFIYNGFHHTDLDQVLGERKKRQKEKGKTDWSSKRSIVIEGFQLTKLESGLLAHSVRRKQKVFLSVHPNK